MERDAKYMAVGIFALLAVAAAVAFVWWYSGASDRRSYQRYEIHFSGTVSGLSQGSPVRYLGVDVGRVRSLAVDSLPLLGLGPFPQVHKLDLRGQRLEDDL